MTRLVLLAGTMLLLFLPNVLSPNPDSRIGLFHGAQAMASGSFTQLPISTSAYISSAMEALDRVKSRYASTFIKVDSGQADNMYYYKLPEAELYLVYEGMDRNGEQYLIHLYEVVIDDEATGIGHIYTYGWYAVEPQTGSITELTN